MGGFPWWLLKDEDIQLRTRDPRYMAAAKRYLREVGRVLGPLQITQGGPILMVQVENEYGFFGKDAEYMGDLAAGPVGRGLRRAALRLQPAPATQGWLIGPDLFPVVNFGSDPAGGFKALREYLPKGPLMCGEFYPGWFDTWGAPHHTGNTARYLADLEYMLKAGGSFSIYMAHGGTTFGFWTGADRPFKPDTSSYDYDAPISEAGWVDRKVPQDPRTVRPIPAAGRNDARNRRQESGNGHRPVRGRRMRALPREPSGRRLPIGSRARWSNTTRAMAASCIGQAACRTGSDVGSQARSMTLAMCSWMANAVGMMDRRSGKFKVRLQARPRAATLDILVEAMGRVNFGAGGP